MKKYIAVLFCMAGCIYFNTFYNAKEYYKKALESTPPNKSFLDKAIQKCEKIVEYHPNSKYVPEAIFLMGKCFLEKEEYEHAARKFKELIAYYPEHRLVGESQLEIGKVYLGKGDYSRARYALLEVEKDKELANRLVIDSYFLEKDYENAISFGKEFIGYFPKSDLKAEVLTKIGSSYDSLGKFESAIEYYRESLKLGTEGFNLLLSIGRDLLTLNRYEEALQELTSLRDSANVEKKVELELTIAKCYKEQGEIEKAIELLEELKNSPLALYEIGVIYEDELSDLEKAREYYELARKSGGSSELTNQALLKASRIGKLTEYREKIQDSTQVEALAETQFLLAELYWLEFNHPDEAIEEYEKVIQNFPKSEYAAKAAYSIAWIIEHKKEDKENIISAYERVEKDFPETEYAKFSSQALQRLRGDTLEVEKEPSVKDENNKK